MPTIAELAAGLEISTRRVSQLKTAGMPVHSIEAAQQWRAEQIRTKPGDSAEQLRVARIAFVKAQERRVNIENDERLGRLIDAGQAQASATRCFSVARAQLLKLASDAPPKLVGLDEGEMQKVLRDEIIEILTALSDETSALYHAP